MQQETQFDLIVVGGGTAGAFSAIAAAREGLKVAVVERGTCLGGLAASWLGASPLAQFVVFALVSFVCLLATRPLVRRLKPAAPKGLDADGNATLVNGEETYTFPVKMAGYVKLCDDENLFD